MPSTSPDISSQAIYTISLQLRAVDPSDPLHPLLQSAANKLIAQLERIDDLEQELELYRSFNPQ